MGFDLTKGSAFDLTKEAPGMAIAGVGMGWNTDADLDVSAFCLGSDGHIPEMTDFVYFKSSNQTTLEGEAGPRPYSTDGGVYGAIDATDGGDDDGDDEDMWIYFNNIGANIHEIVVVVTVHAGGNFSNVSGCYCRIWNQDNGSELCRYTMSDNFGNSDAVEIGKFVRSGIGWSFVALGNEYNGGLGAFVQKYAHRF